ncbi:MAG: CCA tRNA nucleotidyltransferase, partial [Pseudomonadota bacterium]
MTTIAPDWLAAPATRRVMTALAPAGPLFVGGCVRDALMRRATGDIDIAVGTPPEETMALVEGAGLRAHPTGIEHGVITVSVAGDDGTGAAAFEVATFRRDVATDGRRAVVAFTADVTEDAARRDFTMNALYARTDGAVIDPLGAGLHDLAARRLRFVGDADTRIAEDYLRILRFFRFHAQFEIQAFDSAGLEACCAGAPGLARISRERIGAEIIKLLAAPDPGPALTAMGPVLPMILEGADAAAVSALTAAEARLDLAPDPLRRLFALGLAPHAAQTALRLSNAATARLKAIGDAIERAESAGGLAAAAYRVGGDAAA